MPCGQEEPAAAVYSSAELMEMTAKQLKTMLKGMGLDAKGLKQSLVERLLTAGVGRARLLTAFLSLGCVAHTDGAVLGCRRRTLRPRAPQPASRSQRRCR